MLYKYWPNYRETLRARLVSNPQCIPRKDVKLRRMVGYCFVCSPHLSTPHRRSPTIEPIPGRHIRKHVIKYPVDWLSSDTCMLYCNPPLGITALPCFVALLHLHTITAGRNKVDVFLRTMLNAPFHMDRSRCLRQVQRSGCALTVDQSPAQGKVAIVQAPSQIHIYQRV